MTRVLLPLAALLACDVPATDCADGRRENGVLCFPPADVVQVGQGFAPAALAVLDLDGDGALDLAAVNPARQTLSVTWGAATPTRMTSWPVGRPLAGLAHGDFDGDGRLDLAAALPEDDGVVVLSGRGGRRFAVTMHPTGDAPRALLGVDLDGDGRSELVTADVGDDSVRVLRRGVADPPVVVGRGPHALAAGDLDRDGAIDLAVALADEDAVQVLHAAGGTLVPGARHPVGFVPQALVAGDLDGDGALDLATADELGDTVTVILGDGAGDARDIVTWPVMSLPSSLAVVRGGGLLPGLGVMSERTSEVARLDPRTGALTPGASARWVGALAAGDLDRDGRDDLVVGGPGGVAAALRGGEGPRLTADWQAPAVHTFTPVDLDGDGDDELVVQMEDEVGLAVWRDADDVDSADRLATGLDFRAEAIVGADLDADGRADLIVSGTAPQVAGAAIATLVQQPDGRFHAGGPPLALPQVDVAGMRTGDLDGDGVLDVAVALRARSGGSDDPAQGVWRLAGDGLGGLGDLDGRVRLDPRLPTAWTLLDLDGDAALELLTAHADPPTLEILPDGGAAGAPRILELVDPPLTLRTGDLDGDGALDLLYCTARGLVLVRDLDGAASQATVSDEVCRELVVRDLDGDDDLDVLVQYRELQQTPRGARRVLVALANDGAAGFTPAARHMVADDGELARVVERGAAGWDLAFSGPEHLDLLRVDTGPILLERPLAALGGPLFPGFTDLDGDGRTDWFGALDDRIAAGIGAGDARFGPTHHAALTGLVDPDVVALGPPVLADLDGDGAHEAVSLGRIDNPDVSLRALTRVRVDADGEFTGDTLARLALGDAVLFARDLDGDARPDLLLLAAGEELVLTRLRGRGDGSFDPATTQRLPAGNARALVEVDGDGRLDLLLQTASGLEIARGQSGGFDPPRPWGPAALFTRVADVDGDRRPDLVATTQSSVLLLRGDTTGLGPPRLLLDGLVLPGIALADLDGDGGEELLVADVFADDQVTLRTGRPLGDGRFVFRQRRLAVPGVRWPDFVSVHALDLDDDAAPDVILRGSGGGFTVVRQRP